MREKSWNVVGLAAMGLIFFVCTMAIIRWIVDFVTWTTLDSGWAQAIGSVAAIIGAYLMGERQVRQAERVAAQGKFAAALAVIDAANALSDTASRAFHEAGFDWLVLDLTYSKELMDDLRDALESIPVHELGSYQAVAALLKLRRAMFDLQKNITRAQMAAKAQANAKTGGIPPWISWDGFVSVDLCVEQIRRCTQTLHLEYRKLR